ncbi:MAG: transposase [Caldisericia bacterium]
MKKTFKYHIKANNTTIQSAEKVVDLCRILYNLCLEQRIFVWKHYQKSISKFEQMKQLVSLKAVFPDFNNVPSQTLQDVIDRLNKAYESFFRRVNAGETAGFPRFKGYYRYNSFTLKQAGWNINGKHLSINKIGQFKIRLSRPIEGDVKTVTIGKDCSGKWYVCFSCDNVPEKPLPKIGNEVAIDVGCESFLTDSNGSKIENPRFLNKSTTILTKLQQSLSIKIKGSNNWKKAKLLLSKIHEKIKNQRRDFHFKTANQLVKNNDKIYIEKLNVWKTFRKLNRSMRDVAWFNFFEILRFKAAEAGKEVLEVNAKGTSQICSGCGKEVLKDLSVREHNCPYCGLVIDRDYNAALNILRLGQSLCPA